jgi:hypothetical protein
LLGVVEELLVAVIEVSVVVATAVDGRATVRRLGVDDVMNRGDRGAGEVGVLSAGGDAGPPGEVRAVRAEQKLAGRGGAGRENRQLPIKCMQTATRTAT